MLNGMKHRVTVLDTGETYGCDDTENLLCAMVRIGRKGIPSGCHGGGCGVCKIKIEAGNCRTISMSREHVSEAEEESGVVLACRAFPTSDVQVTVLGKMRKTVCGERKYGLV